MAGASRNGNGGLGTRALLWTLPVLLLTLYVVPFAGVISWSVTQPEVGFGQYWRILSGGDMTNVFLRTLRIAVVSTAITILVGFCLSYYWVMGSRLRQTILEVCIFIPFWISVLVRAFGWLIILRDNGLANGFLMATRLISEPLGTGRNEFAVIVGMVHFMVPFSVFPMATVMRKIDRRILLAAHGLGADPATVFRKIFLPLSMPGVFAAFVMVLVFSVGFFVTPAILGGGRVVMVAEAVFVQMFQTTNWGLGAAMSVVLLVLIGAIVGLAYRLLGLRSFVG
ncbi:MULTISPECIES: ABC transporter permease [Mesorhizobium]|uniref:ABC transporter permease n=1 Tax=Mesorhizobium TaxID=68287 RepID=UPI0010A9766F|nr:MULTISPECIES: ABC transporter permease [Mesorhizobium]